jgi:hypothetical protein
MNKFESLKKLFIKILIASLIAAAVVAVIAVLVDQLSDIMWRALTTLGLVAAHAVASLAYIRTNGQLKDGEELKFFSNTVFVIIIFSFLTSVFGTWQVLGGELVVKLYLTYLVLLFVALHGELLSKTLKLESYINKIVYVNYVFMAIVFSMLMPLIYFAHDLFGGAYYRVLAASGIVDATLTILAVIFLKLYLQKHPQVPSQVFTLSSTTQLDTNGQPVLAAVVAPKRRTNPLLLLLGIYIIAQLIISLVGAVFGNMR